MGKTIQQPTTPPPEFDPQADPDHDGWTNAEEAAAGTDPFNSITGILRPAVSHTPAFQTDSDGDGIPETLTPATLHLSWPSTHGKQYSLLHSSHPGDHGRPLEAPFIGNGNQITYHIPATSSTGNFWRVATTDVDTDEDGLTNTEEHQLGTNANVNDSDGDGVPDQSEALQGLNPNSVDTDSDGLSDLDDAVPSDSLIDWEKAPESHYVLIDVDLPEGQIGQDLNDQGQVLTQDGIWSGGLWSPVITPNTQGSFETGGQTQAYEVSYGPSYLFNNSGRIIGHSEFQFTEGQAAGGDILASAGSYGNGGSASHLADAIPFTFQNVVSLYPLGISTDGTTFCRNEYMKPTGSGYSVQRTRIAVQSGTNGQVSFIHAPNDFEFTLSPPSSNTSISRSGRLALNTVSTLQYNLPKTYQLALWNAAGQPQGIPGGSSGYYAPIHLTDLPNGKPALCAMKDGTTAKVWLEDENGTLTESGLLSTSGIQMFAGDGTAVTSDLKLWRNGKQIPLRDLCGRLGQLIDAGWTCNPLKTNRHGSILLVATGPEGEEKSKLLFPIDIISSNNSTLSKLRVAKMIEFGVLNANKTIIPSNDRDSFRIRFRGGASLGGISVKVSTTDNEDPSYNDNPTQVDLVSNGVDALSKYMILVSDTEDDEALIENVGDDLPNDQSHKIQLGGNLRINEVKIGAGGWQPSDFKFPVPVEKSVQIHAVILRDRPLALGGAPVVSFVNVAEYLKITKERYAQVGVKIEVVSIAIQDPPIGVNLSDGLQIKIAPTDSTVANESKILIESLGSLDPDDIHLFFVARLAYGTGPRFGLSGFAFADFDLDDNTKNYTYNAFMAVDEFSSVNSGGLVTAHELGHLIRDSGHAEPHGDLPQIQLMIDNGLTSDADILNSKRLTTDDEKRIKSNSHAH